MDMTAITTPIIRMIPEIVPRINLKSLKYFCQYFFNISSCSQIDKFSISNLETSNLKNIPKLLVVRAKKPANNTRTGKIPLDSEALLQAVHFFCGVLLENDLI